jgi:hypothetical protein
MNQKQQKIYKKTQSFAVLAVLGIMLAMPLLAVASANTVATLTVVPTSDSKVITVIGSGFDPNESVYLALANATTGVVVYNFTESISTSIVGTFVKNVTLPTATYGTYNIYAQTSTVSANKDYTITFLLNPKITVSPDNSNIFKVTGSGFSPYDGVVFTLADISSASSTGYSFAVYSSVYNFTDVGITDSLGNFTTTLIVPTSISGNHTLIAQTTTGATANADITVPDLTGPKGDTGATGDKGAKGATGAAGKDQDSTLIYVAIGISVVAVVISIWSLVKDREPDD